MKDGFNDPLHHERMLITQSYILLLSDRVCLLCGQSVRLYTFFITIPDVSITADKIAEYVINKEKHYT